MSERCDFLVIGAGIVGLAVAVELQARHPGARIAVLEKEPGPGRHQSGRNSGVIHAGIYYAPGSFKARLCREGAAATEAFCAEHGIPFERCGKLVVATGEAELEGLAELARRAAANGIAAERVDEAGLGQLEPHVSGLAGLLVRSTGIVDYAAVTAALAHLFEARAGRLVTGCRLTGGRLGLDGVEVKTSRGEWSAGRLVVCGGLQSDRLIRAFGLDPDFCIVPFRGEFFGIRNQPEDLVRHLIYPVPDPERPFLGVHLTRKMGGGFTVGPNAVLAADREGYHSRWPRTADLVGTLGFPGFWRMLAKNGRAALSELGDSLSRRRYLARVRRYCPRVQIDDLVPLPPGIRAQAVGRDGRIIDDFLFVGEGPALFLGNAPSPAATSALPIAAHIADQLGL